MNKRIVILSSDGTGKINKNYFGIGIPSSAIYVATMPCKKATVPVMDSLKVSFIKSFGEGDGILVGDIGAFNFLRQYFHFGIRNENFSDCCKLKRLSIEGGAFIKCIGDNKPSTEDLEYFMSEDFAKPVNFGWFKQKVLHNVDESLNLISYMDSLPEDTNYGFDYEASGMPLDREFEISGASICTTKYGGFISFTDCRHNNTKEEYQGLLKRLGKFLEKRQSKIWVYNMQYEFQVSHRMLGVTLYNLCDASSINVLDGNHLKKYSLKWTAQNILGATVWDTEFDRISELVDKMLFETTGKTKKTLQKVLKVDQSNFKDTPEWKELISRYPVYESQFEQLILEYWGNPFMCIPSDILGYYCNLDSFYTLMLYETKKNEYSEDAFQTFLDNSRLGSLLHSSGLYIDENFRIEYHTKSLEMMAWGITYCATARCFMKKEIHKLKAANINKFHPIVQKLIKDGKFFNGDSLEIVKYILTSNIDTLDTTDTGINEGQLRLTYGDDFAGDFVSIVKAAMDEVKMKTKIDESIVRKKKILGIIADQITTYLGIDKIKIDNKLIELEKYMYYEQNYQELVKISKKQLKDINNIPNRIYIFGKLMDLTEYSKYVSDELFKCQSPEENDWICHDFSNAYKLQTAFLAAILDSTQQLDGAEKYYENKGISTIEEAFEHFKSNYNQYYNSDCKDLGEYPEKIYTLFYTYFTSIDEIKTTEVAADGNKTVIAKPKDADQVKDVWSNFNGFIAQSQFFSDLNNEYIEYGTPFSPSDFDCDFKFMRKLVINYLLYKKYAKVLSTYIDGMFKANNKWVIEGEDHIPLREADPGEPGAVEKCFVHYEVNTKSSKRWSSGFHTIISHADLKDCIVTPPSWDENGNIIYGGSDYVLTYFDISSAEVKSAGFASMDPGLISKFNAGEDIYIYSAKLYLGNHWEELDKKQQKMWRKRFKTIFLGVLYGLGKKSLAERLNATEEEAEDIIQGLYKSFPKLREYVASQQQYPLNNNGYINTMLGDKLQVQEWKYYQAATNQREKKNQEARIQRLGVNLPIQGGTSSIMASGFMNNIRVSAQQWNPSRALKPIIVVHDSNTNYVPVEKIFEIRRFYDTNYTDYCASFGPKIRLLFDLLCGDSYERAMDMKAIDDNTIQFSGSAYSMRKIYEKIMNCRSLQVECDTRYEDLVPNWVTDPIDRFIQEKGTCIIKDTSKYVVTFKKLG